MFLVHGSKMLQEPHTQAVAIASSPFPPLPSTVSRETETSSHINTPKNSLDTQVNQCLHSSQTTNQPVTRQTAQEPGKENMLFFWASLNFTAFKTQPHGAHPTHGAIKTPVSHWKPIVTRHRPRKLRPGPQACTQSPRGIVHQHCHTNKLFPQEPTYWERSKALERGVSESIQAPLSLVPRPLSTWQLLGTRGSAQAWCLSVLCLSQGAKVERRKHTKHGLQNSDSLLKWWLVGAKVHNAQEPLKYNPRYFVDMLKR